MNELSQKKCEPCEGKTKSLDRNQADEWINKIPGWHLTEDARGIYRDYATKDFMSAVEFINKIAAVAQGEDHHPDLHLTGYRKLRIYLTTHAINGLSENDFILAAKVNKLEAALKD